MPSTGKTYPEDVSVSRITSQDKVGISFANSQPTVNKIGGAAALQKAIDLATRDENPEFGQLYGLKADLEKAEKAAASEAQGTDA